MKQLSIVIVDDHADWCETLSGQLEQYSFFDVVGVYHDGQEALEFIEEKKPDILLLDIIMPGADGLYIIGHIRDKMPDYRPFVCVILAIGTARTNRVLKNLDVDYYFIKPVNAKVIAEDLFRLLVNNGTVERLFDGPMEGEIPASVPHYEPIPQYDELLEEDTVVEEITDYLFELGAPMHLNTARVTRDAIFYYLLEYVGRRQIMLTHVYRSLGEQYAPALSTKAVDRSIRYTILNLMKAGTASFTDLFGKKDKVSCTEFLFVSADVVRKRLADKYGDQVFTRTMNAIRRNNMERI